MNAADANSRLKYVAEIRHVREVALHGCADLGFWMDQLKGEELRPRSDNGKAHVVLTGVSARWMGIPFRELSMALLVEDGSREQQETLYLPRAFNSSRLFAFCERRFFHTPYQHADVTVDDQLPVSLCVKTATGGKLQARMSDMADREPLKTEDGFSEVRIHLPTFRHHTAGDGRFFRARLSGLSTTYAVAESDTLDIASAGTDLVLSWLSESGFTGTAWVVRRDATHSRSKTIRRSGT